MEANGLKTRLVEERWHFLVLALLTERAIAAGRSRARSHANGHFPAGTNGEFPANGAHTGLVAPNGAGANGVAAASQGQADAWELGSVGESWQRLRARLREYFASDHRRALQTALGLLWLLDGVLQFQSFMYSHGFIDMLNDTASGQPGWVASSMKWAAHIAAPNLAFFNTLFALTQVAIGLGLLYRHTVKRALAASLAWALVVWWFGEGFGMLFSDAASPLTGAPGAVLLYGIIGLLAWPSERPGGLLGARGAKTAWVVLWLVMAWAWLLGPSSSPNATSAAISSASSGLGILSSLQDAFAEAAKGNGLIIAFVLSLASAAIGVCIALDINPRRFLKLAIGLSMAYWVIGQGLGGIFSGTATDPNTGLVFALLALALWPLTASTAHRRFGLPQVATGAYRRFGLGQVEAARRPGIRQVGLAAGAIAIALVILIAVTSGGGSSSPSGGGSSSSPALTTGPLASLGHLQSPGPSGPIGPEGIPVPSAPPLAAAVSTTSGKAVDGIPSCVRQSQVEVRRNVHLTIFVQGFARQIPAGIGIPIGHAQYTPRGTFVSAGNCSSGLHTDAADGLIQLRAPTEHSYTLGNFFDIWGQPLGQDHVGPATGRVTALVDGEPYAGNPRDISLTDAAQIQLEVGRPLVAPVTSRTATDL